MHPRLLIKRKTEFLLFVYLTLVTSFLQGDSALICQVATHFRSIRTTAIVIAAFAVIALGSLAVIVSVIWARYLSLKQAAAAALLYAIVFALVGYIGVSARMLIAPATVCGTVQWDRWLLLAAACFTVVAASIFIAVLNMVTTQKADYAEARLRVREYLHQLPRGAQTPQELEAQNKVAFATIREAVQKAYDAVQRSLGNEGSAAYRQYVEQELLQPLIVLKTAAAAIPDDEPQEFFKRIGYRNRGMVPVDVVQQVSDAQQKVERTCQRRSP